MTGTLRQGRGHGTRHLMLLGVLATISPFSLRIARPVTAFPVVVGWATLVTVERRQDGGTKQRAALAFSATLFRRDCEELLAAVDPDGLNPPPP